MAEIKCMLLNEITNPDDLPKYAGWLGQIKENGVRSQIHIKNGKITAIRGRENNPTLYLFPELEQETLPFDTAILDGEIATFDSNNKSIFYGGIDQRRSRKPLEELKKQPLKLKAIIFDALMINGEILINKPYKYRLEKIQGIKTEHIETTQTYTNLQELWQKVIKEDREGIVIKNGNTPYEVDKRSSNYLKLKNYKTTDLEIDTYEKNSKGIKATGTALIDNQRVNVECQLPTLETATKGQKVKIKYLDMIQGKNGTRLIQPTIC